MQPRKRLRDVHIPKFLGIKPRRWRELKANGEAPSPDGTSFQATKNESGNPPQYFWYESTLESGQSARNGQLPSHDV